MSDKMKNVVKTIITLFLSAFQYDDWQAVGRPQQSADSLRQSVFYQKNSKKVRVHFIERDTSLNRDVQILTTSRPQLSKIWLFLYYKPKDPSVLQHYTKCKSYRSVFTFIPSSCSGYSCKILSLYNNLQQAKSKQRLSKLNLGLQISGFCLTD